jgi:hypothetical protein
MIEKYERKKRDAETRNYYILLSNLDTLLLAPGLGLVLGDLHRF